MTTRHRRTARALTLGAGGSTAVGLYPVAVTGSPWYAIPGLYSAAWCVWCAARYYGAHHRAVAEAVWEEARVLGGVPAPLSPCCLLAHHSGGAAHDRRCTDLFHRITADLHHDQTVDPDTNPRSTT